MALPVLTLSIIILVYLLFRLMWELKVVPTLAFRLKYFLKIYWKTLVVLLTPLILLPLPLLRPTPDYKCLYILLLVAIYWVTEALPIPITSMIPIVLLPLLGILSSGKACAAYMQDTSILFLGGQMIAAGVQHSKLPKRLALKTIQMIGFSHTRLNFGLAIITMAISMWISNLAAVTMMLPIVDSILEIFEQQGLSDRFKKNDKMHVKRIGTQTVEDDTDVPQISDTTLCYYMNIAYATSIGGIGTLVGTATNSTFKGIYESRFPEAPPIDFLKWMLFNIPLMLITELLVFIWLQVIYMGMFRPKSEAVKNTAIDKELGVATKRIISEQYVALGPMSFHEKASGGIFILAIFLYVFRSPGFCLGWAHFLTDLPAKESVPTVIIVILMFVVPMSPDFLKIFTSQTYDEMPTKPSPGVITWKICNKQIPWGLMFLLGSGFALAEGSRVSHMSTLIGESLHSLTFLPPTLVLFLVVLVALVITEFTTNVTTASILLPAIAVKVHPLYLMMPTTIACSMVFLMPVGSPVNAVVMGVANIKTSQMMIAGIGPKIIATLLVFAAFPAWGALVYPKTTSFPDWTSE